MPGSCVARPGTLRVEVPDPDDGMRAGARAVPTHVPCHDRASASASDDGRIRIGKVQGR
jgi:hypothetical protein